MKELAADESLSEDARESARKALEVLVSSQLLDIEQTAALKKLDAEAQFGDQQVRISERALVSERDATLRKLEADSQFQQTKAEIEAKAEMTQWLGRHRLSRHAETFASAAGSDAAPSDLVFLTDEDIDEISHAMNRVEKRRLEVALQALREEGETADTE